MGSYEHTSREFLPLSVIRSACAGDTDAVEQVLQHYRGYINKLCTGILYDKHGQPHVCMYSLTMPLICTIRSVLSACFRFCCKPS